MTPLAKSGFLFCSVETQPDSLAHLLPKAELRSCSPWPQVSQSLIIHFPSGSSENALRPFIFSAPASGERSPCLARPCSQGLNSKLTALFDRGEQWQLLSFSSDAHKSTPCSRNRVRQALDFFLRFSNEQIHSPGGPAVPVLSRKIWRCSQK